MTWSSGAAAKARTLGSVAAKRSKYGMTVATWVCCSITSDTHTR